MHDICPFAKNPCRENIFSPKHKQFMCAKNPCFTVDKSLSPIKTVESESHTALFVIKIGHSHGHN